MIDTTTIKATQAQRSAAGLHEGLVNLHNVLQYLLLPLQQVYSAPLLSCALQKRHNAHTYIITRKEGQIDEIK